MALITCPECGKQISDKSKVCINCGYPLPEIESYVDVYYNGFENFNLQCKYQVDLIQILIKLSNNEHDIVTAKKIIDSPPCVFVDGVTKENADWICRVLAEHHCSFEVKPSTVTIPSKYNDKISRYVQNGGGTIICPKCGSNSVVTGAKGANFTFGFIGASKTVNRCANCGNTWSPKK